MQKAGVISLIIVTLEIFASFFLYQKMPPLMASHWNIKGEVDGYAIKFWGLFLVPIISLFIFIFFILVPKIDPLKKNFAKFRHFFDIFIILVLLFLFYLYLLTLLWNLGYQFNIIKLLPPAFGVLFYYLGVLLKHTERNWFIGIRTPWTLSSDIVWEKTHTLGGRLFKASALISFLGLLFKNLAFFFVIIPAITFAIFLFFYSYFEFQKETRKR